MLMLGRDRTGSGRERLGAALRAVTLATALGAMVTLAWELAQLGPLLPAFLSRNELEMARRMAMIREVAAGAGAAAVGAAILVGSAWRAGRSPAALERILWLLSPALLLPAVPVVTATLAWRGKHENLLVLVATLLFVAEVLVLRALTAAPADVRAVLRGAAHRVPR
ncbi:MAG TPA: hypothetical protein PLU22_09965 [Polyangiaceae bacterium]|nr:hypothetical protein [Polyangiaceae bacterium]